MKVYQSKFQSVFYLFIIFVLITSCAAPDRVKRPASEKEGIKNFENMQEDFDPVSLNDYDIQIDEADITDKSSEDISVDTDKSLTDSVATGYRIQLLQTTDPKEAKDVQKDAIIRFQDEVYRVFDPPFYKVRVGDFVNRYNAEQIQKLAIQKGYREAWVIRTKVNLKKVRQWLEDF